MSVVFSHMPRMRMLSCASHQHTPDQQQHLIMERISGTRRPVLMQAVCADLSVS